MGCFLWVFWVFVCAGFLFWVILGGLRVLVSVCKFCARL